MPTNPETVVVMVNIGRKPHASIHVDKLRRLERLGYGKRTPLLAEIGRLMSIVFSQDKDAG